MIQLAFALLPVVWRYALIAGMIYVAGHYLGWAVLEAYSRAALNCQWRRNIRPFGRPDFLPEQKATLQHAVRAR